jgi:hypothetical protein
LAESPCTTHLQAPLDTVYSGAAKFGPSRAGDFISERWLSLQALQILSHDKPVARGGVPHLFPAPFVHYHQGPNFPPFLKLACPCTYSGAQETQRKAGCPDQRNVGGMPHMRHVHRNFSGPSLCYCSFLAPSDIATFNSVSQE